MNKRGLFLQAIDVAFSYDYFPFYLGRLFKRKEKYNRENQYVIIDCFCIYIGELHFIMALHVAVIGKRSYPQFYVIISRRAAASFV